MREYYVWFLKEFNFPEDAARELTEAYDKIYADRSVSACFNEIIDRYRKNPDADVKKMIADVQALQGADIHPYTLALILLIVLSSYLKDRYKERNLPADIWKNSMADLLYKCVECKLVYNVWGVFTDWFAAFFYFGRFALGRLQFEIGRASKDYVGLNFTLKKGEKVLSVHIPRTGSRLSREEQVEAYQQAAEFFKPYFGNDKIVFCCNSWLLFPPVKQMLSATSNLAAFIFDYEVLETGLYDDFYEWAWRLYDSGEKDIDKLPQNTSLRRNYAEYIKSGKKSGWGFGAFIYEPRQGFDIEK